MEIEKEINPRGKPTGEAEHRAEKQREHYKNGSFTKPYSVLTIVS
jgi:hypothetical protein